jgi:hypothetical protein
VIARLHSGLLAARAAEVALVAELERRAGDERAVVDGRLLIAGRGDRVERERRGVRLGELAERVVAGALAVAASVVDRADGRVERKLVAVRRRGDRVDDDRRLGALAQHLVGGVHELGRVARVDEAVEHRVVDHVDVVRLLVQRVVLVALGQTLAGRDAAERERVKDDAVGAVLRVLTCRRRDAGR